jgi:hypothetical protein
VRWSSGGLSCGGCDWSERSIKAQHVGLEDFSPEDLLTPERRSGRRGEQNPPARPRRPGDQSAGEGLSAVAPLTALGEGSVGRSIGEEEQEAGLDSATPHAYLDPQLVSLPAACGALALDGAREIRRCSPIPSPPHCPLPSPRRPGELKRAILSPKPREQQHGPPSTPRQYP